MNAERVVRRLPGIRGLSIGLAVLTAEVVVLGLHLADSSASYTNPFVVVYPFLWVNAAVVGAWFADVPEAVGRRRWSALAVAGGYLLVLAYFGGVVAPGYALVGGADLASPGWYVSTGLPPGYGPAAVYEHALATVVLVPYKLVGYVTLAYLVYGTVVDAARTGVAGLLGLLSCVSCSWPVLAALVSGVAGSGSALAAATTDQSIGLSTAVFVVTVALLAWRPTFG
jgi:hypothetical protein